MKRPPHHRRREIVFIRNITIPEHPKWDVYRKREDEKYDFIGRLYRIKFGFIVFAHVREKGGLDLVNRTIHRYRYEAVKVLISLDDKEVQSAALCKKERPKPTRD
jgi:hypothetical protein